MSGVFRAFIIPDKGWTERLGQPVGSSIASEIGDIMSTAGWLSGRLVRRGAGHYRDRGIMKDLAP
jgi:hypothetical protein